MTYHFTGIDQLIHEAFTRFATSVSDQIGQRMLTAQTRDDAVDALVAHIDDDLFGSRRDLVLTHELYTLAAHDDRYRLLTTDWMKRSRSALERHFHPTAARILDALVEGLTVHRALDLEAVPPGLARSAVSLVVGNKRRFDEPTRQQRYHPPNR